MKKQAITYLILSISLFLSISSVSAAHYNPPSCDWGAMLIKVKNTLPPDTSFTEFSPSEKPDYKNKILSYITAIDNKLYDKIVILRIKSNPETDYLFVNNKLYSIIENWGTIDQHAEKEILSNLTKQFGKTQLQKDNNFYIYSYNSDRTKVLCYLIKLPDKRSTCKVYYYTRQLFRMLISE